MTITANTKKELGVLGSYSLDFTAEGIEPEIYMENFYAENIKSMVLDYEADSFKLTNKQNKEITISISNFGLESIEHLSQERQDLEGSPDPMGW